MRVLTLEELRQLPEPTADYGVYFLWDGDVLNYVGKSIDMERRYFEHLAARARLWHQMHYYAPFTHATGLVVAQCDLLNAERLYIRTYQPPYNLLWTT